MPVILDTWEAEIRRIKVQGQPGQIVRETPYPKWIRDEAQVVECLLLNKSEFKAQVHPKIKRPCFQEQ
jgi:hypothetical protein